MEINETKQKAIAEIIRRWDLQAQHLMLDIDERLNDYYADLCESSSPYIGDDYDHHNLFELLCALKLLRLMHEYPMDVAKVRKVIRLREGEWQKDDGGRWRHVRGGLLQPGARGATYYRWQPYQVFILTAIYGPHVWIDTQVPNGQRELLQTEREGEGGNIEDYRRLCTSFTYFAPRKTDKTGLSGYCGVIDFMLGDYDGEAYCCANSQAQSKIIFARMSEMIRTLNPGNRIRFTSTQVNWRPGQPRQSKIEALSAGGKTKDGLFASYCAKDEIGQAAYVNEKSDMGALVNVIESSMGPRREPLSVTTTTAGTITSGPFIDELDGIKRELHNELNIEEAANDGLLHNPSDRWMALLLQPDEWDATDEERMFTQPNIWKKCNPMLGVIVQHSFYEQQIAQSRIDPLKRIETLTKLFNLYQTDRVEEWIRGDRIRPLQVDDGRRITDCKYAEGWNVFVGMDFSHGDDLFAITYLGVDMKPGPSMAGRFFADCDAWILESALQKSPNRPLYEKWISQGWLKVCQGEVFNPDYAINAMMEKQGVNMVSFGYDPAQSKQPINTLKAWLQTLSIDAATIERMVVPVSQNAMTFNPIICHLEEMILSPEPWMKFSASPLWPWCFQNCRVEYGRNDLRRVVKCSQHMKIDPVHALIDALYVFDLAEGKIK